MLKIFFQKRLWRFWRYYYYDYIKPIFKPQHSRLRKSIPRGWKDLTEIIVDINFEIIKSFYEDEYLNGFVDWEADERNKTFANWLKESYKWITEIKPSLEKQRDNSYPPSKPIEEMFKPIVTNDGKKMFEMINDGIPYEIKYKDVINLEKTITETETEILLQMIKYREYFWT